MYSVMNIMKISVFHSYRSCFFFCLLLAKIICDLFLQAKTLQTVCLEDQHCGSLHRSSKCHRSWSFVSVSRGLQRWGKLCFIRETQAKAFHSSWPALKTKAKTLLISDMESHRNSVPVPKQDVIAHIRSCCDFMFVKRKIGYRLCLFYCLIRHTGSD